MIAMTAEEICRACQGTLIGDGSVQITNITTDSRTACAGSLFAALKGERTDGHRFIPTAAQNGAAAFLCEEKPEETDGTIILTGSVLAALQKIAAYMLQKKSIPVVGIGGSVGKTSTKEAVASVLEQKYSVLKTEGNFNNDLGVPLTVFRLEEEMNAAVIEMGIDDFGQMTVLASITRPNICVLTNIGDCHLENLGDRDGVLRAKSEMFDYLTPQDHIVLNGDDAHLSSIREVKGIRPVFFGLDPSNAFYADEIENAGLSGSSCRIHTPDGTFRVLVPKPGVHMVYNALAAAAVGRLMGLTPAQIKNGIETMGSLRGRFNIIRENDLQIIDDCYNANPMSMKASLTSLNAAQGRKAAVLGDMGELGENEETLHREVGAYAASLQLDAVYCIGKRSVWIAEEAAKNPKTAVRTFEKAEEFLEELPALIHPGDTVLVKASHFMAFDRIVDALTQTVLDKQTKK